VRAIVTGAAGQDGTLLRATLEGRNVEVLCVDRPRQSPSGFAQISLSDAGEVRRMLREFQPDRIFHLAAAHHSSEQSASVELEQQMIETNFRTAEILLFAIRAVRPTCRLLLAGTSHMYSAPPGEARTIDESTPMSPKSFYGRTKAWSRELLSHFRERWGVYGSTAILFNHESALRPPHFVSRKITMAAANASRGGEATLDLLDLQSRTDWSAASDVVEGMRLALEPASPSDYVLASGNLHSVADLVEVAFHEVGLDWKRYVKQIGSGGKHGALIGDPSRAEQLLGWTRRTDFETLIRSMVRHDVALLQR
jgi:GDPmannose 4,6-dehydratase